MIKRGMTVLFALAGLIGGAAYAADEQKADQKAEKKSEPTQAQLALDHGPHAQVTPAVKRARLEQQKAASSADQSK